MAICAATMAKHNVDIALSDPFRRIPSEQGTGPELDNWYQMLSNNPVHDYWAVFGADQRQAEEPK